jgi:hypothetical protein
MNQGLTTADIAGREPRDTTAPRDAARARTDATDADRRSVLFDESDSGRLRSRWDEVQTEFVDSPQQAVQDADALVAELMQHLAETFAHERDTLEQQWVRGEDVTTEDLRVALTRYRSFFERLLDA